MEIDIANLRRDYRTRRLDHAALDPDPFRQFAHWFGEAIETQVLDPNAMSIASVGKWQLWVASLRVSFQTRSMGASWGL